MTQNNQFDDWWKQAVVYQIYPRSFKDSNADGLGDIAGITSRIDYLRRLGVDALWLSPFYPSELADGGYDVIDYRNVDPRLGTMSDFDNMVSAAHTSGMKVIVDIVPNHTSNKHVWFEEALTAEPNSPARNRYIFRNGLGEHGELPPNTWRSFFGGPAWTQVADGQWYLHLFAKEQPDLNWKNPEVHEEFKKTLRFWSDHGTDGFRIDVAHGLTKDLTSEPLEALGKWDSVSIMSHNGEHPLWDRPEVHQIYREWRTVFNEYKPPRFAVGEAWVVPEHQHLYASEEELGQVFNFEFAKANWFADDFHIAIDEGLASSKESGSTTTWVMSNHDVPRHATRYALPQLHTPMYHQLAADWLLRDGSSYQENRALGTMRARAAILMEAGLPGSVYIYQGEELGLFEVPNIPWDRLEDPSAFNSFHQFSIKGRDGCRVPLPWVGEDTPQPADWNPEFGQGASFGFSEHPEESHDEQSNSLSSEPHLPQPLWFRDFAVDMQDNNPSSMLNLYRQTLQLRQKLLTPTEDRSFNWLPAEQYDDITTVAYSRPAVDGATFFSITNFGPVPLELPQAEILLTSGELCDGKLPQDTTVWLLG